MIFGIILGSLFLSLLFSILIGFTLSKFDENIYEFDKKKTLDKINQYYKDIQN